MSDTISLKEKALDYFMHGYSCSECIVKACIDLGICPEELLPCSTTFSAGMSSGSAFRAQNSPAQAEERAKARRQIGTQGRICREDTFFSSCHTSPRTGNTKTGCSLNRQAPPCTGPSQARQARTARALPSATRKGAGKACAQRASSRPRRSPSAEDTP